MIARPDGGGMMRPVTRGGPPDLVLRAISYASRKHRGQTRRDGQTPYASHPFRVLFILAHSFGVRDPEVLAAGVLHDTIEDTTTDYDEIAEAFGTRVAGWVAALTKDKRLPDARREQEFFDTLAASPLAVKLCKLADSLDNVRDAGRTGGKSRQKAKRLLKAFKGRIPAEWRHAMEALRAEVAS
jgi:guanosine-3',5'-bis(diphosphate) 3'-pyrophosphohydrolase